MSRGKHIKNTGKSLWPGAGVLFLAVVLVLGVLLWRVTAKTPQADTGSEAAPEPTARPVRTTPEPTPTPEGTVRISITQDNFWEYFSILYRGYPEVTEAGGEGYGEVYLLFGKTPEGYTWGEDGKVSFEISATYTSCQGTPVEMDIAHGVLKLEADWICTFQETKERELKAPYEYSYLWETALRVEPDEDGVLRGATFNIRAVTVSDVYGYITLVPSSEKPVDTTGYTRVKGTGEPVIEKEITEDTIRKNFYVVIDRSYEYYERWEDWNDVGALEIRYSLVPVMIEGYHISDESTLQVKLCCPALRVEGSFAELDYRLEKFLCSSPVVYEETLVETEISVGAGDDWSSILATEGYMRSVEGNRNYAEVLQIERVMITEASGTLIYVKDEPEA